MEREKVEREWRERLEKDEEVCRERIRIEKEAHWVRRKEEKRLRKEKIRLEKDRLERLAY